MDPQTPVGNTQNPIIPGINQSQTVPGAVSNETPVAPQPVGEPVFNPASVAPEPEPNADQTPVSDQPEMPETTPGQF